MFTTINKADGKIRSVMDSHTHDLAVIACMDDEQVEEYLLEQGILLRFEGDFNLCQAAFYDITYDGDEDGWMILAQRHRGHEPASENGYVLTAVNLKMMPKDQAGRMLAGLAEATMHGPRLTRVSVVTGKD